MQSPKDSPDNFPIDSYLVASRMTEDAILGYHTALGYFGKLHSVRNDFVYLTEQKLKPPFHFRREAYVGVSVPERIKKSSVPDIEVLSLDRLGHSIRVTSLERTVVDVLDRLQLVGSWEEIWRSLEEIEYLDLDKVLEYALVLGNATTIAKTAFFLETHQESLMVPDGLLQQLSQHIPSEAHYLNRHSNHKQQLIARWNLIVPENLINRTWEEPYEDI